MLTITKQSDYGIILIEQLEGKKDFIPLSELVKQTKLPQRFLARIASILVKNKIILSKEGKVGGYKLADNLNKITLYDFLKIFEKEVAICRCFDGDHCCDYQKICRHKTFIRKKLNQTLIEALKRFTLTDLLKN